MVIGLADAAEVAGDRLRTAEVAVRAIDALGVQRLHVRRADDLHGRGHGEDVFARRRLLGDVAHADIAAGHQLATLDGLLGLADQPGEVLQGTDLEGNGVVVVEGHAVCGVAEDAPPILRQRDEGAGVALLSEPPQTAEEGRGLVLQARETRLEVAGLVGLAVDLVDAAILLDQIEQAVDKSIVGARRGPRSRSRGLPG